jgi:hypothetical protein
MDETTDKPDDEFFESLDLAHQFIDEFCSDAPLMPSKGPATILRALGHIAYEVSDTFKISLEDALAIIDRDARDLGRRCREIDGEDLQ